MTSLNDNILFVFSRNKQSMLQVNQTNNLCLKLSLNDFPGKVGKSGQNDPS